MSKVQDLLSLIQNEFPAGGRNEEVKRVCKDLLSGAPEAEYKERRDTFRACWQRVVEGCKVGDLTSELVGDIVKFLSYLPEPQEDQQIEDSFSLEETSDVAGKSS